MRYHVATNGKENLKNMSKVPLSTEAIIVCRSKVRYATKMDALRAISKIRDGRRIRNKQSNLGRIEPYQCPNCGGYHHAHSGRDRKMKTVVREEE